MLNSRYRCSFEQHLLMEICAIKQMQQYSNVLCQCLSLGACCHHGWRAGTLGIDETVQKLLVELLSGVEM